MPLRTGPSEGSAKNVCLLNQGPFYRHSMLWLICIGEFVIGFSCLSVHCITNFHMRDNKLEGARGGGFDFVSRLQQCTHSGAKLLLHQIGYPKKPCSTRIRSQFSLSQSLTFMFPVRFSTPPVLSSSPQPRVSHSKNRNRATAFTSSDHNEALQKFSFTLPAEMQIASNVTDKTHTCRPQHGNS